MHVLNQLEGTHQQIDDPNTQDNPEATDSTNIREFGRLYSMVLLTHGPIVSLSMVIKKGAFKKPCNGLSNKPLMHKVFFTNLTPTCSH